jgi:hypothetical protein
LIDYYSYVVFDIIFFYFGCSIASLFKALGQVIKARKDLNSTLSKKLLQNSTFKQSLFINMSELL